MKKRIIFNLFFIICLFFIFSSSSLAAGLEIKQYFKDANSTLEFEKLSSNIYSLLRTIGLILAVCIMMTMAISYMIATPSKRAELKGRLVYYIAGVVFLIAGVGLLGWYAEVAEYTANVATGKMPAQSLGGGNSFGGPSIGGGKPSNIVIQIMKD